MLVAINTNQLYLHLNMGFLFGKEINAVEKVGEEEKADGPEFDE